MTAIQDWRQGVNGWRTLQVIHAPDRIYRVNSDFLASQEATNRCRIRIIRFKGHNF